MTGVLYSKGHRGRKYLLRDNSERHRHNPHAHKALSSRRDRRKSSPVSFFIYGRDKCSQGNVGAPGEHIAGNLTRVDVTGRILRGHGIWTQLKETVELSRGEPGELQIGKGERETASSKVLKGSGSREEPCTCCLGRWRRLGEHLSTLVWTEVNSSLVEEFRACSSEPLPMTRFPAHAPPLLSGARYALPATPPPPGRVCPRARLRCPGGCRLHPAPELAAGTEKGGSIPALTLREDTS